MPTADLSAPSCHPERSEGPIWMGLEMLCCAQHDSAVLLPLLTPLTLIAFDELFLRLMRIIADLSAP